MRVLEKSSYLLFICVLLTLSREITSMDMDMDLATSINEAADKSSSVSQPSLKPVPHVMKHHHGLPILETNLLPEERMYWNAYDTTTYFNTPSSHRLSLYLHIIFGLISMIGIFPVSYFIGMLKLNSWYLVCLNLHTGFMLISLANYFIFINSIEDLYPGNAYHKMTWILLCSTIIQYVMALIKFGYKYIHNEFNDIWKRNSSNNYNSLPIENFDDDNARFAILDIPLYDLTAQGTTAASLNLDVESSNMVNPEDNSVVRPKVSAFISDVFELSIFSKISTTTYNFSNLIFTFLNKIHFFYYLIYISTGVATFALYGTGSSVFNLVAHFIKGGVFFVYGIVSLARYSGGFHTKGWSWNHKFITEVNINGTFWNRIQSKGLCTMEMIESSLILFYGSTNIFLEHLSNSGKPFSAKDLQHVSIAFIYIGSGLCGIITEIKLANWRYEKSVENLQKIEKLTKKQITCHNHNLQGESNSSSRDANESKSLHSFSLKILKASPGFSPNPFPIVTVYWTGVLMSSHEQASALSTAIHIQWGQLFVIACAFRFITYILLLVAPLTSKNLITPLRPITELIVSFSLLCGGLIFMESTDPVIQSFEYYGFTSMFTLSISLGLVMLTMSWIMCLFALKDWLIETYLTNNVKTINNV